MRTGIGRHAPTVALAFLAAIAGVLVGGGEHLGHKIGRSHYIVV